MSKQKTIMIVDDTEMNIDILVEALQEDYELIIAINGVEAVELLEGQKPDLILLDIMMPEMDGYEVLRTIKRSADLENIPVILLSAITDSDSKTKGFLLGAVDYVTKPFEIVEVKARVRTQLKIEEARLLLENQNQYLEEKVKERTKLLERTNSAAIYCLAAVAETRDPETGEHIKRTQGYIKELALELQGIDKYQGILTNDYIELLYQSAPLHDIGKVGVRDSILLKPGRLTEEEFEEMKKHTIYGGESLMVGIKELGEDSFLTLAKEIALTHHEKWDGSGYPRGLAGVEIPISGRLMAVSDVYDALISKRVYKNAFTHDEAREIILESRGTHFDPDIVDAFLRKEARFIEIREKYLS
ncbi:HD-GYP domain-containing protein [Desulfosporosinus meridiei]|uniref:Stage 0 sporulation protein A homolog n=1 Tax=Desulfosporosinus meridiei (strain ATCC BAA-275 / DSM 13257 / KCTC 12902 / NCIMB 13706 / S10) TaxID=768704 RepID=J7J366_DESMD|nr:HD domain-containing phosphohydrolase [Desulfosporosinus meridiei]AFQ45406.1 response regulator containing a CheY-like receiver domain and an HD-GYP domain [Desulfosporosinus meridiei DSM 13257]